LRDPALQIRSFPTTTKIMYILFFNHANKVLKKDTYGMKLTGNYYKIKIEKKICDNIYFLDEVYRKIIIC